MTPRKGACPPSESLPFAGLRLAAVPEVCALAGRGFGCAGNARAPTRRGPDLHGDGDIGMKRRALRASLAVVVCAVGVVGLALLVTRGVSPGAEGGCVVVDDFAKAKVGEFPPDWKVRKDAGKEVYTVQEENGRKFLRAVSRGLGIQAAKPHEWDPAEYPVLAWSWRPQQFPEGANERTSKTNDSAIAVYAVWPHSPVSVKSLKYVWSAVVPVGTHLTSSRDLTQVRVLESGTDRKGQWVEERVNVLEDFKRYFGGDSVPKAEGIAVLTDSDDTKGVAAGDYADFRLCRS
jgi:DUF3047 family protein